jgi:Sulfotransferase domain
VDSVKSVRHKLCRVADPIREKSMPASDFVAPPEHGWGPVGKVVGALLLFGLLWPLSRLLMLVNRWPPLPLQDNLAVELKDYQPLASDVFVCSYFKSGTTWLLQIVTQIAWRGRAEFENIHHVVPWPEAPPQIRKFFIPVSNPSPARLSPTSLRAIKTHMRRENVPQSIVARYIVMIRDPKAVAVSGYHFMRATVLGPTMVPFRRWVDMFLAPHFFEGAWAVHLASYWIHRTDRNVLFLTYHDLRADLGAGVDRIARFMGVSLSAQEREAVIERSTFAAMKRDGQKFDPGGALPWSQRNSMIRDGGNAGTSGLLEPGLAARIDDHCRSELHRLNCDFDYDAAFQ